MVSEASLQNLIPIQSRWGMATKAIRVPLEFLEDIYAMIEEKILSFHGENVPAEEIVEQTEDEWIADIMGAFNVAAKELGLKPAVIKTPKIETVEEFAEIETETVETKAAVQSPQNIQQQKPIQPSKIEPEYGTEEWIDYMESAEAIGGTNDWNWRDYLKMVKLEAKTFPEARAELRILKANGWTEPNFRKDKLFKKSIFRNYYPTGK